VFYLNLNHFIPLFCNQLTFAFDLFLQKEEELFELCGLQSLSDEQVTRFLLLVSTNELDINFKSTKSYSLILRLCRYNHSKSLYPCLKSILTRDDVHLKVNYRSNNILMLLCHQYPLANELMDSIRLLVKRGFDINEKNNENKTALSLLSENVKLENFVDIAPLLINDQSDLQLAEETVAVLRKRNLNRDADILSRIVESYRLGQGRINNEVSNSFIIVLNDFEYCLIFLLLFFFIIITERRGIIGTMQSLFFQPGRV